MNHLIVYPFKISYAASNGYSRKNKLVLVLMYSK